MKRKDMVWLLGCLVITSMVGLTASHLFRKVHLSLPISVDNVQLGMTKEQVIAARGHSINDNGETDENGDITLLYGLSPPESVTFGKDGKVKAVYGHTLEQGQTEFLESGASLDTCKYRLGPPSREKHVPGGGHLLYYDVPSGRLEIYVSEGSPTASVDVKEELGCISLEKSP
jgi:hypothetical protein